MRSFIYVGYLDRFGEFHADEPCPDDGCEPLYRMSPEATVINPEVLKVAKAITRAGEN